MHTFAVREVAQNATASSVPAETNAALVRLTTLTASCPSCLACGSRWQAQERNPAGDGDEYQQADKAGRSEAARCEG